MTSVYAVLLIAFATATLVVEFARQRNITPIALLTVGHLGYVALNPLICLVSPANTRYFIEMVNVGGAVVPEGLGRVFLAAAAFQLGCLVVSLVPSKAPARTALELDPHIVSRFVRIAVVLLGLSAIGTVWLGILYEGSPLGLYRIPYGVRTEFIYELGPIAFMADLVQYGAALLVTILVLTGRTRLAVLVLGGVVLHSIGVKSKHPIVYVGCVFAVVSMLSGSGRIFRALVPLAAAALIVSGLGLARTTGDQGMGAMLGFLEENREQLYDEVSTPWSNDLPGPAAVSYLVVNSPNEEWSLAPLAEIITIFVPRLVVDRGPSQADSFARQTLRGEYFVGAGMGWSMVCDGYRSLGILGTGLAGALIAAVGSALARRSRVPRPAARLRATVYLCVASPLFLLGPRYGVAGFAKQLVILFVLVLVSERLVRVTGGWLATPARTAHD